MSIGHQIWRTAITNYIRERSKSSSLHKCATLDELKNTATVKMLGDPVYVETIVDELIRDGILIRQECYLVTERKDVL